MLAKRGALAWYLDAAQLVAVLAKFQAYAALDYAAAGRPAALPVGPRRLPERGRLPGLPGPPCPRRAWAGGGRRGSRGAGGWR